MRVSRTLDLDNLQQEARGSFLCPSSWLWAPQCLLVGVPLTQIPTHTNSSRPVGTPPTDGDKDPDWGHTALIRLRTHSSGSAGHCWLLALMSCSLTSSSCRKTFPRVIQRTSTASQTSDPGVIPFWPTTPTLGLAHSIPQSSSHASPGAEPYLL